MRNWSLTYNSYLPDQEPLRESLCTLGNGYFATRGSQVESSYDGIHYPGTYIAGGYNRLPSVINGKTIINEDLVNFPNWLCISFQIDEEGWFDIDNVEKLAYHQALDMQHGILIRRIRVKDTMDRITTILCRQIVHMANPHLAAIEYTVTAENWSGNINFLSGIDGSVTNEGVAKYSKLNSKHLQVLNLGQWRENCLFLQAQTSESFIRTSQIVRHQLFFDNKLVDVDCDIAKTEESIFANFQLYIHEGQSITLEKVAALFHSRDLAFSDGLIDAQLAISNAGRFSDLFKSHQLMWQQLWHRCDIEITSKNETLQRDIRLNIFHLLQSVSLNSINRDVGAPSRGLHGEADRGHIFWDELFISPFYIYHMPEVARSLLLYRFHRLNVARYLASEAGFNGALFPWESGSNGEEKNQQLTPDFSHYQRHVNLAIAYNIWQYVSLNNDILFLDAYGMEMLLEIARFWASATTFNKKTERYEIHGVIGPDSFHEKSAGHKQPGLSNNAYTNVMVVWLFECVVTALNLISPLKKEELFSLLKLTEAEIQRWQDIAKKMTILFHDDEIISQFAGYEKLTQKISKQADVLMLFYLLPLPTLEKIFHQLGYSFNEAIMIKNIKYYHNRTSHSTIISKVVHASLIDNYDPELSFNLFLEVLANNISDDQGFSNREGIHLAAMAGALDMVLRNYAGIVADQFGIHFNPKLPSQISQLRFRIQHHKVCYLVEIDQQNLTLILEQAESDNVQVKVFNEMMTLNQGKPHHFAI